MAHLRLHAPKLGRRAPQFGALDGPRCTRDDGHEHGGERDDDRGDEQADVDRHESDRTGRETPRRTSSGTPVRTLATRE
jgi:hypothetical protein